MTVSKTCPLEEGKRTHSKNNHDGPSNTCARLLHPQGAARKPVTAPLDCPSVDVVDVEGGWGLETWKVVGEGVGCWRRGRVGGC